MAHNRTNIIFLNKKKIVLFYNAFLMIFKYGWLNKVATPKSLSNIFYTYEVRKSSTIVSRLF